MCEKLPCKSNYGKEYQQKVYTLFAMRKKLPWKRFECFIQPAFEKIPEKQKDIIKTSTSDIEGIVDELKQNAIKLENEDIEINKKIGDYGAEVVPNGDYIVKLPNGGFTIVDSDDFEEYFDFEGKNEYIKNIKEGEEKTFI